MQRLQRRGPPKHLERTLFINHKEDQMLDDRLRHLNLESRLKSMELDRERSKVRTELRNSRKKQITINEAISSGMVPADDAVFLCGGNRKQKLTSAQNEISGRRSSNAPGDIRRASAPPQRKNAVAQPPAMLRSLSNVQQHRGNNKMSSSNQFSRHPTILEHDEYDSSRPHDSKNSVFSNDTVGTYVLGEFEKISQVVPDILRALAKKKEKQQEADELARLKELRNDVVVDMDNIMDYEPDMNKVRKTVRAVKKLRHRMAISKKLETSRQHKSLDQMIKDKTEDIADNDQYTDGTCALMKRRLEKKRRESAPFLLDPQFSIRRLSLGSVGEISAGRRRLEVAPRRASSLSQLPGSLSRSATMLSVGSVCRLNSVGTDSSGDESPFIDEDLLVNRQRIMREIDKCRALQNRVDSFITSTRAYSIKPVTLREQIVPL